MGKQIYLAGPITGCTFDEATSWRDEFIKALNQPKIQCFSPMRAKTFLAEKGKIEGSFDDYLFGSSRNIMARDHNDCTKADCVVFNLFDNKIVSIGTIMELAWCYTHRIPTVVIIGKDDKVYGKHPMVLQAIDFRVETVEEAADAAHVILMP